MQSELLPTVEKGATLSDDGVYRYRLWRRWGDGGSLVFVMLNPSTADATEDDPTIRRCIGFARSWGYDGIQVVNLYALRATNPKGLLGHPDPEGPGNPAAWREAGCHYRKMVAAWGVNCHMSGLPASRAFWENAPIRFKCVGITKGGDPKHPLYVRGDTPLTEFTTSKGTR